MATFKDSLPRGFEAAVEAGDFDAQTRIYAEDAIFSAPMHPPARGRDSIRAMPERITPPRATANLESMDTGILGPYRVHHFRTVTFSFTPEGAEEPQTLASTYFALFERTDQGWKITREALSLKHPPAGVGK
jgi:ketosteroid isomerase-like protein